MKKMLVMAVAVLALASLTACMGIRGREGNNRICENEYFLGISLIEVVSPCGR